MGIENLDALKAEVTTKTEAEMAASFDNNVQPGDFADGVKDVAHLVVENPEDHCGDVIPDPWSDSKQTDWPNNESTQEVKV